MFNKQLKRSIQYLDERQDRQQNYIANLQRSLYLLFQHFDLEVEDVPPGHRVVKKLDKFKK